jgi:hypothetical protein
LLLLPVWRPSAAQVLLVCAPPSCSTLLVCNWDREHTMDSHRALLAHADVVCGILATRLTCAHTSLCWLHESSAEKRECLISSVTSYFDAFQASKARVMKKLSLRSVKRS